MFLRNCWYVTAWDHEVGRDMMARTICDEPVVLYRREDGAPVALADRCVHRRTPLSLGKLIGDRVRCPYHGLEYDPTGQCVRIPGQTAIPPGAEVKRYPVIERYHWIWIWLGNPALADPALITDFHWTDDHDWRAKGERLDLEGNYLLLVDNLLDLSHLTFIHATTLGTDAIAETPMKAERGERMVRVTRWIMDSPAPPFFAKAGGFTGNIDRWQIIEFTPPSFVRLDVGGALAGTGAREGDRSQGITMRNLNAITPETETTTHYFWAQAHDFGIDDPKMTELLFQNVHTAFLEDLEIIKAQQETIDTDPGAPTIDVSADGGGIQARRMVERLIDAEAGEDPAWAKPTSESALA